MILIRCCLFFLMLMLSISTVYPKEKKTEVYTVWIWQETGDCLWNIAKKYYGDPYRWRLIYEANKDKILNPAKIYPKQKLLIPFNVDSKIRK